MLMRSASSGSDLRISVDSHVAPEIPRSVRCRPIYRMIHTRYRRLTLGSTVMALLTCLWGPVPRALTRPGYVRGIWSRVAALRTGLRARCDASGDVVPPVRGVRVLRRSGGAAREYSGLVDLVATRVVMQDRESRELHI